MFDPYLPQNDPDAAARTTQLGKSREKFSYSYAWPPGVAVAASVPEGESYSALYIAALLPSAWEIFKNTMSIVGLVAEKGSLEKFFAEEGHRVPKLEPGAIGAWYMRVANDLSRFVASEVPVSVEMYDNLYAAMTAPGVRDSWDVDRTFAWQRIAGVNPMTLTRISAVPPNIAIGEKEYARAIHAPSATSGGASGNDTLAAALAEGRVFACDYTMLHGAACGTTFGRSKWLPAPYAIFAAVNGGLRPVAIQIAPTAGSPVAAAGDGNAWRVAKLAVQVADANHHETIVHLGRTHMVMEAVTLALNRQIAERHPLWRLIRPHCDYTLPINNSAATNLIAKDGAIDCAFGGTIEASAAFVKKGLEAFDLRASGVPTEIANRGVADASVLTEYPYRDDALLVFAAIRRFVDAYVRLYYASDADVSADVELRAFADELGSESGGRIRGVGTITTIEDLVGLLTNVVWIASGQHAAVNFTQYPYMGVVPNMVGAMWSEWPPPDLAHERAFASLLPPYNLALLQLHTVYQLSSVRINHLGHYGLGHFLDLRVHEHEKALQNELAAIETTLKARDPARYLSYPHLFPSNIPRSIHI
jgi:arachidonate 15-lipoxygenase